MEYSSAMKKNELLIFAVIWMGLKGIILNEKNKTISKGHILCGSMYIISKWQNYRDGKHISGCQGLRGVGVGGRGEREVRFGFERQHEGTCDRTFCKSMWWLWSCAIVL